MKTLTDQHLESCCRDKIDITLVKQILNRKQVIKNDGYIDVTLFSQWVAQYLEDSIEHDYGTDLWVNSFDSYHKLGEDVAIKINNLIQFLNLRD